MRFERHCRGICAGAPGISRFLRRSKKRSCESQARQMDEEKRMRVIGTPRRRVDARAKVTGQTRFADDIVLPRMLHCRLLRSPHPHADILEINSAKAKKI